MNNMQNIHPYAKYVYAKYLIDYWYTYLADGCIFCTLFITFLLHFFTSMLGDRQKELSTPLTKLGVNHFILLPKTSLHGLMTSGGTCSYIALPYVHIPYWATQNSPHCSGLTQSSNDLALISVTTQKIGEGCTRAYLTHL